MKFNYIVFFISYLMNMINKQDDTFETVSIACCTVNFMQDT